MNFRFFNWFCKKEQATPKDPIATAFLEQNTNDYGKCFALVGDWGSGKTHRWKKKIKPILKKNKKKIIYISLFGKQSIKKEFFEQVIYSISPFSKFMWVSILFVASLFLFILPSSNEVISLVTKNEKQGFFIDFATKDSAPIYSIELFNMITASLLILIIIVIFIKIKKYLFSWFFEKHVNLVYSDIPYNSLVKPKKYIICFDDFERLAKNSSIESFLGLCDSLKRQGFSILIIYKEDQTINNITESMKKYKEKVIDATFEQSITPNHLNEVILSSGLKDEEVKILTDIFNNIKKSIKEIETTEKEIYKHQYIIKSLYNLRFLKKINEKLIKVKSSFEAYEKTDKLKLILNIALIIAAKDNSIGDKELFEYDLKSKTFIDALYPNSFFYLSKNETLIELLDKEQDLKQVENYLTETEFTKAENIIINEFIYHNHRTTEIKTILENVDKEILNSDKIFSSLDNCKAFLTRYCHISTYCDIVLPEKEIPTKLLINKLYDFLNHFKENELIEYAFPGYIDSSFIIDSSEGQNNFSLNINYINEKVNNFCFNFMIDNLKKFFYTNSLMALEQFDIKYSTLKHYNINDLKVHLLMMFLNDSSAKKSFFNLKDEDFSKYQKLIKIIFSDYISKYINIKITTQKNILNNTDENKIIIFLNDLKQDFEKLAADKRSGIQEKMLKKHYDDQINGLINTINKK